MSRATVELDFFGLEKEKTARFRAMEPRSSIRGIQSAMSRINPQVLRSVLAAGGGNAVFQAPAPAVETRQLFPSPPPSPSPLPALGPASSSKTVNETSPGTAPLTIFYKGTVTVFDIPRDKAEGIIKLAEDVNRVGREEGLLEKFNGSDLPMARKRSLQRFLEKRKERLTVLGPYQGEAEASSRKEEAAKKTSVNAMTESNF